jgi:hypothetical protein
MVYSKSILAANVLAWMFRVVINVLPPQIQTQVSSAIQSQSRRMSLFFPLLLKSFLTTRISRPDGVLKKYTGGKRGSVDVSDGNKRASTENPDPTLLSDSVAVTAYVLVFFAPIEILLNNKNLKT